MWFRVQSVMVLIHAAMVLAIGLLALSGTAIGQEPARSEFYCDDRGLGHWFYCRTEVEEEDEAAENVATPDPSEMTRAELLETAEAFRQRLEEQRLLAVYAPTRENVMEYQQLQWQATSRAATFSDHWRRNTWGNSELDYTVQRPVAQYARHAWLDERGDELSQTLSNMSDNYGLFYFYRSDCPYCQRFSPVLRGFADQFGVEVRAISVDGGPMDDFPNARRDEGQFARLLQGQPAVVPAVLLLNTETNEPQWITFGLISGQELAERIFVSITREVGEDY